MDGEMLIKLLREAGHEPRSYSGRGMFGERCVGLDLESTGELFKLGVDLGVAASQLEWREGVPSEVENLPRPSTDSMGLGIIAYWPSMRWPDGEHEVEIWRCGDCGARNREADLECADCGYGRYHGS